MNDDDDIETALELLPDEPEPPQISDPTPELLMDSQETEAYLDKKYPEWRKLPPPPGALVFGAISFSRADLDVWLEKNKKYRGMGDDDGLWL